MNLQIKSLFIAVAAAVAVAAGIAGCSGNKDSKADAAAAEPQIETAAADVRGQWYIENIIFSDSDYVRPDEAVPGVSQYMVFEDSTFFIRTNCNSISGPYSIKGDSIILGDGPMTEMACDNMAVEDALRRIPPAISTIEVQSDSVIRLNGSTPAECILLHKAAAEIK